MKFHSMLSKALLKSRNKAMPGILSASVHSIMLAKLDVHFAQ